MIVSYPNIVVDPIVVVRVVVLPAEIEMTGNVLMAEEDTIIVEA